eukprot:CAMPEP_0174272022 /NCGR_PEP_ID=MMETSP0439-20130205/49817_1 /TAXON_ID=0 /ORGANISM="Stereomyxa ramosa, Strain Chinc5" /LENGTH=89 /DNA_ID=CAMNT_0015362347 /DNA_START=83 /DNA_END=349 /DNA_ORIENTATION=-
MAGQQDNMKLILQKEADKSNNNKSKADKKENRPSNGGNSNNDSIIVIIVLIVFFLFYWIQSQQLSVDVSLIQIDLIIDIFKDIITKSDK